MAEIDPVQFGELRAKVDAQGREIGELKTMNAQIAADLKDLLALANRGRGGLWAGMMFVSIGSSVVGWIAGHFLTR